MEQLFDISTTVLLFVLITVIVVIFASVIVFKYKYYRYQKRGGKLSYIEFLEKEL